MVSPRASRPPIPVHGAYPHRGTHRYVCGFRIDLDNSWKLSNLTASVERLDRVRHGTNADRLHAERELDLINSPMESPTTNGQGSAPVIWESAV